MNQTTARIGFWSAIVATVFGSAYVVALLFTLAGVISPPLSTVLQLSPSLILAWSYLAMMACIYDAAGSERRIWALLGLCFALIYATLNSFVYFGVLTSVVPAMYAGKSATFDVLLFEPGKLLFAVNGIAYGLMSLSALFASQAFAGAGWERRVRWSMIAFGLLAPFVPGAVLLPVLTAIGALWIVLFPAMGVMLTVWFRRAVH